MSRHTIYRYVEDERTFLIGFSVRNVILTEIYIVMKMLTSFNDVYMGI